MCEPERLSMLQILKFISKSLGNGEIAQTEVQDINQNLLKALSSLRFQLDHSFLYYFLETSEVESIQPSWSDNSQVQDDANESANGKTPYVRP